MSGTIIKLIELYESQGCMINVGLNSHHFVKIPEHFSSYMNIPFAYVYKNGSLFSTGAGISVQEIYMLECLGQVFHPKKIFIIGNAFGWGTVAISLLFPESKVVAIDNMSEGDSARQGFDLTCSLIALEKLNCEVVIAESPGDVSRVVQHHLDGKIDLAFIDGLHTNQQQKLDYQAILPWMNDESVILFHDVVNHGMLESFYEISEHWHGYAKLLLRTPSGMGICYSQILQSSVGRVAHAFSNDYLKNLIIHFPCQALPNKSINTAMNQPDPENPDTLEILKRIFAEASQGTLPQEAFLNAYKILSDAQNHVLANELEKIWNHGKQNLKF